MEMCWISCLEVIKLKISPKEIDLSVDIVTKAEIYHYQIGRGGQSQEQEPVIVEVSPVTPSASGGGSVSIRPPEINTSGC